MSAHRPKVALVDATEAKNRFGALIKRAYEHEEHLIVRRGGLPVVAIIPVQDYEQLVSAAAQGEAAAPEVAAAVSAAAPPGPGGGAAPRVRLRDFLAAAHGPQPAAPLAAVEQDVDAAVKAVRQAARRGPVPAAPLTTRTAGRRAARRR